MLLPIHVAAGGIAMILGAMALLARKGGSVHRRSGLLFVGAMLVMGISAAILGVRSGAIGNVFSGLMTAYFVITAWTTVRAESEWTRRLNIVAFLVAAGLALFHLGGGVAALISPRRLGNGVPFPMLFFLAVVLIVASAGDLRILRYGRPHGGQRLARHLWRMCFALFIALGSFVSIRERVAIIFPEPFTTAPARALPVLALFFAMFYWMWRVRSRHTLPVLLRNGTGDAPKP